MARKKKRRRARQRSPIPEPVRHLPDSVRAAPDGTRKYYFAVLLALIVAAGLIVYANSFSVPFVFDDLYNIVNNPEVTSLGAAVKSENLSRIVGTISFAINYRIHGLNVIGYHVVNLLVHLANALLVFWLVLLTLKSRFFREKVSAVNGFKTAVYVIALFSALFFVTHPVQTQAVTYIVQRLASLATLFYLLALVMYIKYNLLADESGAETAEYRLPLSSRQRRYIFYSLSLVSTVLAMLTKQIAFTLPLVLILWEFSFSGGRLKRRILRLVPFTLTLPLVPLTHIISDNPLLAAEGMLPPPSTLDYLFTQFRVLVTYLRLLVIPVGQNLDYDYPVFHSFLDSAVLLSFCLLALIVACGFLFYYLSARRDELALLRLSGFGLFFFFIAISVESSVITISDVIFEHRLYLPSAGIIIAAVAAVETLALLKKDEFAKINRIIVPVMALLVIASMVAAYSRNNVWRDEVTLWEDVVRKSPGKARPHNSLGIQYVWLGDTQKAEEEYRAAIDARPDYFEAHYNLGLLFEAMDEPQKAEEQYRAAIEARPEFGEARTKLGLLYAAMGDPQRAEEEYKAAIEAQPDFAEAHINLGILYASMGDPQRAEEEYRAAIEALPYSPIAHNNLGYLYMQRGELQQAEQEYKAAIQYKPDYAEAYYNLGMTYVMMKRFPEAVEPFLECIELSPDNYEAHNNLGNIYAILGANDKAIAAYEAALAINPDYQDARENLQYLQGRS